MARKSIGSAKAARKHRGGEEGRDGGQKAGVGASKV